MIAIVNISPEDNPTGLCEYEVRINREVITTFSHVREQGLATCLRLAADAVDKKRRQDAMRFMKYPCALR